MQFPDVAIMNSVMIYDKETDSVLVQDRTKKWTGGAFPGGHLEIGESVYDSCVREVFEETGLCVKNLIPCGLVHWSKKGGGQEFIHLYRTHDFTGDLLQCDEGINHWVKIEELINQPLAGWFRNQLPVFFTDGYTEMTYTYDAENDKYIMKTYGESNIRDISEIGKSTSML